MELTAIALLLALSRLVTVPAIAQPGHGGRCGYDIGNACSLACNVMTNDANDLGVYWTSGDYSMSYSHVDCPNPDIVCGWSGDGIVFNQQNGSCPSGSASMSPDTLRILKLASHGRLVYLSSCAGGFYPTISSDQVSTDLSLALDPKRILTRQFTADSLERSK